MDFNNDFEESYFSSGKGKMHYKHHKGPGAKILFIHGLGSNSRTWIKMVQYLPQKLDIYLLDLLGHGLSDAPQISYTVELHVQLINEFICSQKGKFMLFGHSYGGWLAALCAQANTSVSGLILEDSSGLSEFSDARSDANPEHKKEMLREALMLNQKEYVVKGMIDTYNQSEHLTEESLNALPMPVLIIWGSEDRIIDIRYAKIFKRYIRDSRLEVMHGVGHTPHYTNPREVAEMLERFISGPRA